MLTKCANPECIAKFLYLHAGKLFAIEFGTGELVDRPLDWGFAYATHNLQYFWLCPACARAMTIRTNGKHGVELVTAGAARLVQLADDSGMVSLMPLHN